MLSRSGPGWRLSSAFYRKFDGFLREFDGPAGPATTMIRLGDARALAIRKQMRIRFRLENGMECLIDEHGVSRVPGLKAAADFNLEEEFARAGQFSLETVMPAGRKHEDIRKVSRAELEALAATRAVAAKEEE
jgi:hypothetical protein